MTADPSKVSARLYLGLVALFLGELRDGLTMINMQSAFLIVSKLYSEKQAGILFFVFGMSQFLFQAPAGYIMDYTDRKVTMLAFASVTTTALTILTAATAKEYGANLGWMIVIKFFQGGVTALIPPGLNSITQGIVGSEGMTRQVSDNEMRNHFGTAIIVLTGSLMAFFMYPDIGMLFLVSPVACAGVLIFLYKINPSDIDHNAARGLAKQQTTADLYNLTDTDGATTSAAAASKPPSHNPSFNFGSDGPDTTHVDGASSPLVLLKDTTLLTFIVIVFLFHTSNGTVLPLVMQTLAIGEGRVGILMSGLCIIVAQIFMVGSAKVCGDYSGIWGRKTIFLTGLFSVPVRCLILYILTGIKNTMEDTTVLLQVVILSTQILDGVGAGVFGTMYILVTSDISAGTGRFSLTLGMTSAAMSIGGTVSGYLGQALAQDRGYQQAFLILGFMSCVPAFVYLIVMPETLNGGSGGRKKTASMAVLEEEDDHDVSSEERRTVV
jgi:MFS family permease